MKTRKNFKRRALLVSIAMLMVAAIALGTATFAWFTASTTATASGIHAETARVSNLQISKYDHVWGETVDYDFENLSMHPVSTDDGENWFTAVAAAKNNFARTGDFVAETENTNNGYYWTEEINVKNNGQAPVSDVTIAVAVESTAQEFLRFAIVPVTDEHVVTGTFADCVYDNAGIAYDGAATLTDTTSITPLITRSIAVGDLAAGAASYYKVIVWFEGQDAQCYDTNAAQVVSNITFTVTGTTGTN